MNRKLLDQFKSFALPELLEDSLEEGDTRCIAFNRWGTILAAGLADGRVILWDFETRGVARSTQVHTAAVTSLSFSNDGRLLTATGADGSAKQWNIESDVQEGEINLGQYILYASVSRKDPRLCLVSFPSIAPSLIDFREERSSTLPCLQLDMDKGGRPVSSGMHEGTMAVFSKSGELVFLTLANGCIAVLKTSNLRFIDLVKVPGGSRAINLALSRNGQYLVVNYQDRVIRAFEVLKQAAEDRRTFSLPELRAHLTANPQVSNAEKQLQASIAAVLAVLKLHAHIMPNEGSVLYPEAPLLKLAAHSFQNQVTKNTWQCATFTSDSEHVAAAAATKDAHHIHIWTRWGRLERILEGPTTGVRDIVWHPTRSLMASVSTSGAIFLWACVQTENWSAFAPDFTELQENEEYVEPEDVFDINSKQNGVPNSGTKTSDEELPVDILSEQQVQVEESSDVEADLDRFDHLPVDIIPQEFDEEGQLVIQKQAAPQDEASPGPSSSQDSDPAISEGGDSKAPSPAGPLEKKHRLASISLPDDDQGARLRPGRQKRYLDDLDDEEFLEEGSGEAQKPRRDFS